MYVVTAAAHSDPYMDNIRTRIIDRDIETKKASKNN
jgi:hypothetical protein